MQWITIEEFNKDPQDGYYWVCNEYSCGSTDKSVQEYRIREWWECGESLKTGLYITHVMPIKEPQDP